MFSKAQYNVLILGLDDAGKTTFLEQLRSIYSGTPSPQEMNIPPTVGLNIGKMDVNRAKIVFWDLGGQVGLRVLWDKYFSDAHALVYVVDATNKTRLQESHRELGNIMADKELAGAPVLVMVNKQDVSGAVTAKEVGSVISDTTRSVLVQPAAVKSGVGVRDGIDWLLDVLPTCDRTIRMTKEGGGL